MELAVLGVFDEEEMQGFWQDLPRIKKAKEDLGAIVADILEKAGIQATPITGLAKGKNRAQVAMINSVLAVAGDLHDIAVEEADADLLAKCDVHFSDLAVLADAAVGPRCQELLKLAKTRAKDLKDAGTTAADLTEAQRLTTVYVKLVAKPRQAIVARKEITQEIVDLIEAADKLLHDRLDRLMRKFKTKAPVFSGKYINARIIVDLGTRHEKKPKAAAKGASPAAAGEAL